MKRKYSDPIQVRFRKETRRVLRALAREHDERTVSAVVRDLVERQLVAREQRESVHYTGPGSDMT